MMLGGRLVSLLWSNIYRSKKVKIFFSISIEPKRLKLVWKLPRVVQIYMHLNNDRQGIGWCHNRNLNLYIEKNVGLSFFKNWQERLILTSSGKVDLDVVTSRFFSDRWYHKTRLYIEIIRYFSWRLLLKNHLATNTKTCVKAFTGSTDSGLFK